MKTTLTRMSTMGALLIIAACGSNKSAPTAPDGAPLDGKVNISPKVNALTAGQALGVPVCASFQLQSYQLVEATTGAAAGTYQPVLSDPGEFFTFTSTTADALGSVGATTNRVAACAAGPTDTTGSATSNPQFGDNWGYYVNVYNFVRCDGITAGSGDPLAVALAAIPFKVINAPIDCTTSDDVDLDINVPIDVPLTVSSGYVDISAGVDVTGVYVGCKNADIGDTDGQLHFGETYATPNSPHGESASWGIAETWLGNSTTSTDLIQQFTGTATDQTVSPTMYDESVTGIAPPDTTLVYQTFQSPTLQTCDTTTSWYFGTNIPECIYDSTSGFTGPTNIADLANASIRNSAGAWVASIRGQTIDVLVVAGPKASLISSGIDGANSSTVVAESSLPSPTFLAGLTRYQLQPNSPPGPLTGVYPDLTGGGFWITADTSIDGEVYAPLSISYDSASGLWNVNLSSTWLPIPDAPQAACLGLFSTSESCATALTLNSAATCAAL